MESKITTLQAAAALVQDGQMLACGGNTLNRAPMAFVRELARAGKKNLHFIKTAAAHDVDVLCAAGCVASVDAGFVSYESDFGLATHYRRAVEQGAVKTNEHACYTVICALRAAAAGIPFMPVRGLLASDLLQVNPAFSVVEDPFGAGPVAVVKAFAPDVAVVHVHKCDPDGNAVIDGSRYEDELLVRAARMVILTAENIVPRGSPDLNERTVHIPGFLVRAVVHAPRGAAPCGCYGLYEPDAAPLRSFLGAKTPQELAAYLGAYQESDRVSQGR